MALHSRYAVTVSAVVATRSRSDCSSMEDRQGNKRPYQAKHSPSLSVTVLGAICGSARSMDRAAQSMDPYFVQESMDRAGICGSLYRSTGSLQQPYLNLTFMN